MKLKFPLSLLFATIFLVGFHACERFNPFDQYNETHRPQYHFTSPANWVGPPAAMVYYKGEYHVFFLQNRTANTPETKSWGHAVSRNLVHWEHRSVALFETEGKILAGSVVIDWENSAEFVRSGKEPAMVALYTTEREGNGGVSLQQHLAYSNDSGRTWTQYENSPVLDKDEGNLRDPKVFWHSASSQWIMILAVSDEQKVRFYGSSDLKIWEQLSEFSPDALPVSSTANWERPEMFNLPVDGDESNKRWVLQVNVDEDAVAGGSGALYFIGEFDGKEFIQNSDSEDNLGWVNYGRDFYGAASFSNIPNSDGRRIWMAWMNNWKYAERIPTSPWKGALTIPREIKLRTIDDEIRLVQQPVVEQRILRTRRHRFRDRNLTEESNFLRETGITGRSAALIAEFQLGTAKKVGFELRRGEDERTIVGYDAENEELFVDRTESGETDFDSTFAERYTAPLKPRSDRVKLRIYLDRSSVEVFGNDGEAVITAQIFPKPGSDGMALYVRGGEAKLQNLDIWQLEKIW